ncbi:MAG: hypothetical protein PHQ05_08360 [Sterolibacterium sp.]|nr:hypothetical protein [Sterolibacterium sp.]
MLGSGFDPMKAALVCAAFLFTLMGCATPDSFVNLQHVAVKARERGFSLSEIRVGEFHLAAYLRTPAQPDDVLVIYIEGDGAPWLTPYHPPLDPTPLKPTSLSLAVADTSPAIAYLGRPCQYLEANALRQCDSTYWVERRFAPEVVSAYDEAVSRLKMYYSARRLRLVGYSGGGVIATLLAMRRDDVELLLTVAAPLAISEWVAWHGVSPLTGSLDPAVFQMDAHLPPSVHFVGGHDRTVPASIVESFVHRRGGRIEVVSDFDHECCWARDWKYLLGRLPNQKDPK